MNLAADDSTRLVITWSGGSAGEGPVDRNPDQHQADSAGVP
jgi:hypothetical protein